MHIMFEDARTALRQVVAAAGEDHHYEPPGGGTRCVNAHQGRAHCLAAKVLEHLGVDVAGHCERRPGETGVGVRSLVMGIDGLTVSNSALAYLATVQSMQDRKQDFGDHLRRPSWGWVRDQADTMARQKGWRR